MPRYVLEDPTLPHQIVLTMISQGIAVSCNCIRRAGGAAIEIRSKWTTPEAMAAWRAWHER